MGSGWNILSSEQAGWPVSLLALAFKTAPSCEICWQVEQVQFVGKA